MNAAALAFAVWVGADASFGTENLYDLPTWEETRAAVHQGERTLGRLRAEARADRTDPWWWNEAADGLDARLDPWRLLYRAYTPDEWGDVMPDSHRLYVRTVRESLKDGRLPPPVPPPATRLWAPWIR